MGGGSVSIGTAAPYVVVHSAGLQLLVEAAIGCLETLSSLGDVLLKGGEVCLLLLGMWLLLLLASCVAIWRAYFWFF